jgi:hypothetical protein
MRISVQITAADFRVSHFSYVLITAFLLRRPAEQAQKDIHPDPGIPAAQDRHPGPALHRRPGSEGMERAAAQFFLLRHIGGARHLPVVQEDCS